MQAGQELRFAPFRLDPQNARLWRGKQLMALTPKAFAVLCHLVEHAGQLVTKDALLTAVWPEIYVSEGVLSECVREIRQALGDTPQVPRFIQTVHRRGYRFIGKVVSSQQSVASRRKQRNGNWQLTTHLVGRETELAQLQKWLKRVLGGARQLVFVTGEAGIGKTTVVDAFVARLSAKSKVWIGRGQCIDHYGQGEAYLPVLEALGRMCREPEGNQLIDLLSQHAPTWLVQMPALLSTTELESLQRRTQGATRERMLRELAEAMEVLTTERPLVLWLEDLQWSDVSTLDWLAFIARRQEPARLLIMGTYRPVEVIVSDHSLKPVKQELQLHGQCVELPLSFLTEEHVAKYLVRRFASPSPASAGKPVLSPSTPLRTGSVEGGQDKGLASATLHKLAQLIHQRTEGNPLFMINLVDYLITQGVLARIDKQWRLQGEVTAVASWAPESLQGMIETQIERLSPKDRRVLEVASVAGVEFSAAAVAAGVATTIEEVEEQCGELARHEQFLRARGTTDWPDGTVAARYGFLHALYQDVFYGRLTARQQQRLHQQIGERVEQAYGERAREIAAELAMHFERGREYDKAIQYLKQAGLNAEERSAYHEARSLFLRGVDLLQALPDSAQRVQQELSLQISLGWMLQLTKGPGSRDAGKAYTRAVELSRQVEQTPTPFPLLSGLWYFYFARMQYQSARELAEEMLRQAQDVQPSAVPLREAHFLMGITFFILGEFLPAREHLEQAVAQDALQLYQVLSGVSGVNPLSLLAHVLWCLGYPEQALQRSHTALIEARRQSHFYQLAEVLGEVIQLHLYLREWRAAQERAEEAIALSSEHGFPLYVAVATVLRGRALAEQGEVEEGIAQIQQGMSAVRNPLYLYNLAAAYEKMGQAKEGLTVLEEALAMVSRTGHRCEEAELYRLKGALLLTQEGKSQKAKGKGQKSENTEPRPLTPDAQGEAEACFLKAIEVARRQSAKSWELRATVSLARLWQSQGKRKEAHKLLAEIYGWFTEGFDTKDLQEAKALLEELKGRDRS
jgi:DNA-binding winged helix-turn-helix (wHTH) protein/tetratricopeptide (TPR) repeat protein